MFEKRIAAQTLRRKGVSIIEIARKLGVAKSTASIWCLEIKLTSDQEKRLRENSTLAGAKGRFLGAETNRLKKTAALDAARVCINKALGHISGRDILVAGPSLYWAEGSKSSGSSLSFVNSDSDMIRLIVSWLKSNFGAVEDDFILRVAINEIHRPRERKVLEYWSRCLKVPQNQFRKTSFIKTRQKKVYANYDTYYGTLCLRLRRSSSVWYRVLAGIEIIKKAGVVQW